MDPRNAIEISDLTKIYRLYNKPSDRLKEALGLSRQKRYRELKALDSVNFSVKRGETVGIIGTNGSGKSTLLKIITGVLSPTSGRVDVDGRISALLELGAGFNQEYTGIENIYLNGTMSGFSKAEIDARLDDIISFADIGEFIDQPVKTYSSGMFVRLAFAVAINIDPEILIVDEALSVGDVFFQAKCYKKFEDFRKEGKTILFVSHDLSSISKYCDRVILLDKGVMVTEGGAKEVVDLYKQLIVKIYPDAAGDETADDGDTESSAKEAGADGAPGSKAAVRPAVDTGPLTLNPNTLEYGEGHARIVYAVTKDSKGMISGTISKGEEFSIVMRVRFDDEVEDPIFAYTIKNIQGTEISGTNTLFEGTSVPPQKPGNVREAVFTQRMTLQGGEYLISFGCTGYRDGEFHVFHRLYDALGITCVSDRNTVGFYDMEAEVSVH